MQGRKARGQLFYRAEVEGRGRADVDPRKRRDKGSKGEGGRARRDWRRAAVQKLCSLADGWLQLDRRSVCGWKTRGSGCCTSKRN